MFSKHLAQYAEEKFNQIVPLLGAVKDEVMNGMAGCSQDEQILMKFLYGTMPLRDAGEYDFAVFLGFVKHALMVKKTMKWCEDIAEDMFLHHILYYRVNSENIEDCRGFFYEQLIDQIQGLSVEEAVIKINYWCAQSATYEASDNRTISPMTVYRSGKGRCGEESTFAVTALRSVGIPARQVYTPRWAHCDDNHAWVEAYVDGKWYFFGACEPEEILNKGWFTNASSRALLVHSRTFSDYSDETAQECIGKEDLLVYYNNTSNYAQTKLFSIQVVDEDGNAMSGVTISVEILNMAEYCNVVTLHTDAKGRAALTLGLGDIHIHAMSGDRYEEAIVSVRELEEVILTMPDLKEGTFEQVLHDGEVWNEEWMDIDIEAPVDYPMHPVTLTKEQKEENRRKVKEANQTREARIESYFDAIKAESYQGEVDLLHMAKGNFSEIYEFLSKDKDEKRKQLLHSLSMKDYKDAKAVILEDHLQRASAFADQYEMDIYTKYILCPRLYLEEMTPYRSFILAYFNEEEKLGFLQEPVSIWTYIKENIVCFSHLDYKTICSTPIGCLKLKQGNALSQRLLFVAICRTLGIPARINRVNLKAEYFFDKTFHSVPETESLETLKEAATLRLTVQEGSKWSYYQTWTIGLLREGQFKTLDYTDLKFDGNELELQLEAGIYRIIHSSRMPSGNQYAREITFCMKRGEQKTLAMNLREGNLSDLLVHNELAEFELLKEDGSGISASILTAGKTNIFAFLEEGKEPTEHVLNEMIEQKEKLCSLDAQIICVVKEKESLQNQTFEKARKAIPNMQIYYDDFSEQVEALARRMYVDPDKLPLLIVTKPGMNGVYAVSGYHVGSVDLMINIVGL